VYLTEAHQQQAPRIPDSQSFVLRYLSENGAKEIDLIAGAADVCSYDTARQAIFDLAKPKLGYISRTNVGAGTGRSIKAIYDLTEKGRAALAQTQK
jgi:hypothetical protein